MNVSPSSIPPLVCPVWAVDGVPYYIDQGEIVGIVGESGCGKSVTQLPVLQLITKPGTIVGGEALLNGVNILLSMSCVG